MSKIKTTFFGEASSEFCGCIIEGIPAGFEIDMQDLKIELGRSADYHEMLFSARMTKPAFKIVSGVKDNVATGEELTVVIKNAQAYFEDSGVLRPGSGDFGRFIKSGGAANLKTSEEPGDIYCFTAAGVIIKQLLAEQGIYIGSHIAALGSVTDEEIDLEYKSIDEVTEILCRALPVFNADIISYMKKNAEEYSAAGDTIGGVIECFALNLPAGLGGKFYDSIQSKISSALFALPGVCGAEFSDGFAAARRSGKKTVDELSAAAGRISPITNNGKGIDGGYSNGLPLIVSVSVLPSPGIGMPLRTVDYYDYTERVYKGDAKICNPLLLLPAVEGAFSMAVYNLI